MMTFDNWPAAVLHDRTKRKKMTRKEYGELVGLTAGIIQGAEGGRKMKATTIEKLLPVVGDLLPTELGGTADSSGDDLQAASDRSADMDPRDPIQGIDSLAEHERVRAWLVSRFDRVKERLGDKPAPPIGTPGFDTASTPRTCTASEFTAWGTWLDQVEQHLGLDAGVPAAVDDGGDWLPIDPGWDDEDEEDVLTVSVAQNVPTVTYPGGGSGQVVWSQGVLPVAPGGAMSDLELQLKESVERARNNGAALSDLGASSDAAVQEMEAMQAQLRDAMAVSSTPDGQREDMEPPARAERLKPASAVGSAGAVEAPPDPGVVVQGPWEALDPPQMGRRTPDKIRLDPELTYITNSALQTFSDCRRRWWLEYYRKLSAGPRAVTGAAALGTRIHQALSVIYVPTGESPGDPFEELHWTVADDKRYLEKTNASASKVKELEAEHDFASIIIEGYLEWLQETGADRDYEVIATEHGLVVNPGFPDDRMAHVRLLTKEDTRLYRHADNAVLFIDHKTVQSFDALTVWAHMNRQLLHYGLAEFLLLAEQQFAQTGVGIDEKQIRRTDGAILNMLRKVKRTPSAKPPFFMRHQIRYNVDTFRSYWRQVFGTVREMLEVTDKLDNGGDHQELCPPRPTSDCSWKCQFFVQCSMFDDGSDVDRLVAETFVTVDPLQRYDREVGRFVE